MHKAFVGGIIKAVAKKMANMYDGCGHMLYNDVHEDETLEELGRGGLVILQKKAGFRFGTDSILLADFAHVNGAARVGDFGTGSAILPLLVSANAPRASFEAWEIQPSIADMALRTVRMNGLEARIHIHSGDARDAVRDVGSGALDAVVCNPPYYISGAAIPSESESLRISKHGTPRLLEELICAAAHVIKYGGRLFTVYPVDGMADMLCAMRSSGIEPKRMRLVHTRPTKPPILMLTEGMRGGKSGLRMSPPLVISDENGNSTPELKRIYHMA